MNEAETRAEHIDPALKAAGWGVVEGSRIRREYSCNESPRDFLIRMLQVHRKRLKNGVGDHRLANWPTSF
jgi:predicted type IV restriction endonuclease